MVTASSIFTRIDLAADLFKLKSKALALGIAPLNEAQRRFITTVEGVSHWHWLSLRKLAAPIARVTDFGPAVMQPTGILYAPISHTRPSSRDPCT